MKTFILNTSLTLVLILMCQNVFATSSSEIHWDSTTGTENGNFFVTDDNGGETSNFEYRFDNQDITTVNGLIISDGTVVDHTDFPDSNETEVYPYNFDHDQGGLDVFTSDLGFDNVDIIFVGSLTPLTAIHFSGNNTGFGVDQFVYIENDADFVILEFKVTNSSTETKSIYTGFAYDFDVYDSGSNESGYDEDRKLVYQYNTVNGYAAGLASLVNEIDQYRLGYCCAMTDSPFDEEGLEQEMADPYALIKGFLLNSIATEECDDGNNVNNDGCSANCLTETAPSACHNDEVEIGEACEDVDGANCTAECMSELCGDGTLDEGEDCDDGNTDNNDGCSAFCTVQYYMLDNASYCGDGFINGGGTGDQADSALNDDMESALSVAFADVPSGEARTAAFCLVAGKGTDGTDESVTDMADKIDACATYYETNIAICGNGVQNAGEGCDDGNTTSDDGCSSTCTIDEDLPICGDSTVDDGEECDDGNTEDGDGCNSTCEEESSGGGGCQISNQSPSSPSLPAVLLTLMLTTFFVLRTRVRSAKD